MTKALKIKAQGNRAPIKGHGLLLKRWLWPTS
jgi:hypothetical protein